MNHTELLTISALVKEANIFTDIGRAGFRTLGHGIRGTETGLSAIGSIPGAIARGGGRFGRWAGGLPGQMRQQITAGYKGAPIWNRTVRPASAPQATAGWAHQPVNPGQAGAGWMHQPGGPAAAAGARAQATAGWTHQPGATQSATMGQQTATGAFGRGPMPPEPPPAGPSIDPRSQWTSASGSTGPGGAGAAAGGPTFAGAFGRHINEIPNERFRRWIGGAPAGEGRTLEDVGRTGFKRMAVPGAYAGWMGLEAPGKMRENAQAEWQGQHPFVSMLGRMTGMLPEARPRSYLMPNLVQG